MIKLTYGVATALSLTAGSLAFGTVNENDVHRFNQSVANHFFDPSPGKMFEVADGTATPICTFANAHEAIAQDEPQLRLYRNNLGRAFPVAQFISSLVPQLDISPQVELTWGTFAEGLDANYRADLAEDCERLALEAYKRDSVICVVDNVFRTLDGQKVLAVRFKHFAFAPDTALGFPVCPLKTPRDPFWSIRRQLISVAILADEAPGDDQAQAEP